MTAALIAFGGNLGNVRESFELARSELATTPGISLQEASLLYRTPPLGPPGQPDYLNAVIRIETTLTAINLLDLLQQIETRLGRQRGERWGARTIDLDIVDFGGMELESGRLTLPHPEMHHRMFVLRPLCDIAPSWQHPKLLATALELKHRLTDAGEGALPEGERW